MFGNPVPGRIQAKGEAWLGPPTFRVTATFDDHMARPTPSGGIDFGNGQCGSPVYAMEAGTVSLAGLLGAAKVVRIEHPQLARHFGGRRVETGYAHLATMLVSRGQTVVRGQQVGTVGMTGADACHLHGGCKIGGTATNPGPEIDFWPLLDQNIPGGGAEMIEGTNPKRIENRKTFVDVQTANFRPGPTTKEPQLAQFGNGTVFLPDFEVTGEVVGGSGRWQTGMLWVDGRWRRGYFHVSVLGPLSPAEATGAPTAADIAKWKVEGAAENEAKWEAWNTEAQGKKP